jgi:hypothetical protein
LHEYDLWYSQSRKSKILFPDFMRFLKAAAKRKDILDRAEITSEDSDWEKFVKLGQLRFSLRGFKCSWQKISNSCMLMAGFV